jgi:7-cyano-7-deazaguanine synthase
MQKSIILLSSGLDSVVSCAIACRRTRPLCAITFDYGQRARHMEIGQARKVCRHFRIRHHVVGLPFFRDFVRSVMIGPPGRAAAKRFQRRQDVWVPNRNAVFVNIAAAYAEYFRAGLIVTGFNREEAAEFPDNTPAFVAAVNASLDRSTLRRPRVISFVQGLAKREIYRLGLRCGAPLQYVYSCYLGGRKMCGRCASCRKLLAAQASHDA